MMRAFLATVPPGSYSAEDFLDDDGVSDEPVRIAVRITFPARSPRASKKPRPVVVDFTGSSPQVEGSINAVEAITYLRVLLCFPLPAARRRSRHRRTDASDSGDRSRRDRRQRASAGGRGRRQCRNLAAHRRCAAARAGAGAARAHSRSVVGHHEQSHHRRHGRAQRCAGSVCLLRDHRRRLGRQRAGPTASPACTPT